MAHPPTGASEPFPPNGYSSLPEVVPPVSYPEVALDSQGTYPEVVYNRDAYPEVVSPLAYLNKDAHSDVTSAAVDKDWEYVEGAAAQFPDPEKGVELPATTDNSTAPAATGPRGFVWSRKLIIALGVLTVLIVIAAVVGGVVGSKVHATSTVENNSSSNTTTSGASGATGTSTASGIGTATSATSTAASATSAAYLIPTAVAAMATANGKPSAIQVFFRTDDSTDIEYTTYGNGVNFNQTNKLQVKTALSSKAPMAMVSKLDSSSNTIVSLYYISSSGSAADISELVISCEKGFDTCSETSQSVITTNVTHKVHPSSGLAAVWLGGNHGNRVYYQSTNDTIVELNGDAAAQTGWKDSEIGGTAISGSRIAVTWASGPKISVFYADVNGGLPTELTYSGGWKSPATIDSGSAQGWNSSAALTACYVPTPDIFHFYYTSPSTGSIVEYTRGGSDSSWVRSGTASQWLKADSSVAAIGWLDQVRLYYTSSGRLQQSLMGNGTWKSTAAIGE